MRKQNFNSGWTFHEGGGSSLDALLREAAASKAVILPHDAMIEKNRNPETLSGSGNGFFQEETINYTKEFLLEESEAGKNIWLEFEGVYQNAFVYVNNSFAGKCAYGYGNFYIDITKYVRFDRENHLQVVVKNGVPSGRWYTGGGIYRDVNLMIADRMHFAPDSVRLTTADVEEGQAVIKVESTLEYTGTGIKDVLWSVQLIDAEGRVAAESSMPVTIEEHSKQQYQQKLYVADPLLWNVDTPYLYQYRAVVKEQDAVLDEEVGTFGIRKLQLDPKNGLRINGKSVKLRGGCIHHDHGVTGAADFAHAAELRIKKMKEAGYNAIRSAHNPLGRKFLEACDKQGMLVMDEFSDVWTSTKVDYDYGMHMTEWWEHDVTNFVSKDYNHPCVIMYSIGNEIPETGNKFDVQWGKKLADKIRSLDASRYIVNSLNLLLSVKDYMGEIAASMGAQPAGAESAEGAGENAEINSMMSNLGEMMNALLASDIVGTVTEEAFAQVDIAGYNYAACRYEKDGIQYPNRIIVGSETYPKDLDVNWELVEKYPHVIGDFAWTAWDYLGEAGIGKVTYGEPDNTGFYALYPYKAAYCGDANLIGDRRPVSYWREIIWGLRKAPYLAVQPPKHHDEMHIVSNWGMSDAVRSWNWKGYEGKAVTVEVYADADEAELYVNGELIGKKKIGETKKCTAQFETIYTPGILQVITYKDGEKTGEDSITTAKEAVKISAFADAEQIPADASDICYVEISIVDEEGNLNPDADKAVTISVEGPGVIQGFGSADPASEENYFDRNAKAYEGRLRAAIRGNGEKGDIIISLQADGCEEVKVKVEAV